LIHYLLWIMCIFTMCKKTEGEQTKRQKKGLTDVKSIAILIRR